MQIFTHFALLGVALLILAPSNTSLAQERKRERPDHAPKTGEMAPDFDLQLVALVPQEQTDRPPLKETDRPQKWKLSSQQTKKPIVLAFGSYT
jgi:hypothetical protein